MGAMAIPDRVLGDLRTAYMGPVGTDAVKRRLKFDYLKVKNDPLSKDLEIFTVLLAHFHRPQIIIHDMIHEAAALIQKQLRFRWCMIGLRDPVDMLYRYEVMAGMRSEAWTMQRAKVYKLADFDLNAANYRAGEISRLTRVYLEEENVLLKHDEGVVNRPALLRAKRKAEDEMLEADFVDTLILGPGDDLLGWIEYSGTIAGKFPDALTIRQIETVSAVLGAAIVLQR